MLMVSAEPPTVVDHPFDHRNNPVRKSCLFIIAVESGLHPKKIDIMFVKEERMVNYKQLGFVGSAFFG